MFSVATWEVIDIVKHKQNWKLLDHFLKSAIRIWSCDHDCHRPRAPLAQMFIRKSGSSGEAIPIIGSPSLSGLKSAITILPKSAKRFCGSFLSWSSSELINLYKLVLCLEMQQLNLANLYRWLLVDDHHQSEIVEWLISNDDWLPENKAVFTLNCPEAKYFFSGTPTTMASKYFLPTTSILSLVAFSGPASINWWLPQYIILQNLSCQRLWFCDWNWQGICLVGLVWFWGGNLFWIFFLT